MSEKLMEKLKVQAQVVRTHHRNASQSTTASEPAVLGLPPRTSQFTHSRMAALMCDRCQPPRTKRDGQSLKRITPCSHFGLSTEQAMAALGRGDGRAVTR
ncbi:hypothetical protein C8T65DRAFT_64863 [Cerioporus squamosus]|nr:hypothetical protein C8T65DRAFT_64863 [Cerioporus squamosus]